MISMLYTTMHIIFVLQHHVSHSTTLFYARNFLDLQATLKLSYLWSGLKDHSCPDMYSLRAYNQNQKQQDGYCSGLCMLGPG